MKRIVIVGGGAAGVFAAIACATARAGRPTEIVLLEKGPEMLTKVRISGGGRCNVTHACFDPRALAANYPRGERALIGPFSRFQPSDTQAWFAAHGVRLKTESDGRMFPVTDSSQTIIDCLLREARLRGVIALNRTGVNSVERPTNGGFNLSLSDGGTMACDSLLLATGGCRTGSGGKLAASLGHSVEEPVPSLFTFNINCPWLKALAGLTMNPVEVSVPDTRLRERGSMLITHWGVSGPAILRLSAWGARVLHDKEYRFPLRIHWLPDLNRQAVEEELRARCLAVNSGIVARTPVRPIPARLWEQLVLAAGIDPLRRWGVLSKDAQRRLTDQLTRTEFEVTGKSTNKAEFVTCGGVRLDEVNLKTMESRVQPGLYLAGELLDIDGITGGFNFQAAWTTGWLAGNAMAEDR